MEKTVLASDGRASYEERGLNFCRLTDEQQIEAEDDDGF
jgi:hypothetical protein